jgi:hypothetical protein
MAMMVGFTLFLIYAAIFRNDSNCHCFGSLVEMNPWQSIIKNIIVLILVLIIKNEKSHDYGSVLKKWLTIGIVLISLVVSFVLLPMDVIYNRIYTDNDEVNEVEFYESLSDSTFFDLQQGRHLINYALAGCKFCRLGTEKLVLMVDRHQIPHEKVKFFIGGSDEAISRFIENTNTSDYDHWKIPAPQLMSITYGRFPLYVFIEDGKVKKAGDFRILDDDLIMSLK